MKQVSIGVVAVVLVGALAVGFLLGRYVGRSAHHDAASSAAATAAGTSAGETASTQAGAALDGGPDRHVQPALTPATSANTATGSSGNVATTAPGMQPGGGPQVLPEAELPKFANMERGIRANGGSSGDWLELSEREEQDDEARRIEQMLAMAVRRHGDSYTDLRLSSPRCTRSVCILRAIGKGTTENPRSSWQRLSAAIASEPWWRQTFDGATTTVGGDINETIYITMFQRCEPGQCRFADR